MMTLLLLLLLLLLFCVDGIDTGNVVAFDDKVFVVVIAPKCCSCC